MKKIFATFIWLCLAVSAAPAQDLRLKAETDPLDCAYYLLTKDSLEDTVGSSLTGYLFAAGRHEDALRVFKLDPNFHFRIWELSIWGIERVKAGDYQTARKISDAAFDD